MVTMKTWPEKSDPLDKPQDAQPQNRRSTDNYLRKRAAERARRRPKVKAPE